MELLIRVVGFFLIFIIPGVVIGWLFPSLARNGDAAIGLSIAFWIFCGVTYIIFLIVDKFKRSHAEAVERERREAEARAAKQREIEAAQQRQEASDRERELQSARAWERNAVKNKINDIF